MQLAELNKSIQKQTSGLQAKNALTLSLLGIEWNFLICPKPIEQKPCLWLFA